MANVDRLRLIGSFGSNKVMAGELSRLVRRATSGLRLADGQKDGPSSVVFPWDPRVAAIAMQYHRTSARVLWELWEAPVDRLDALYEGLRRSVAEDQRDWCRDGEGFSVQALGVREFPAGERQVMGAVKNALLDGGAERGVGLRLQPDQPDFLVDVRYAEGKVRVGLDLGGRAMHQRGYRHVAGPAPLREDLAALLVMLTRFDARTEAFIDPMAGAGTIGIEAASMAVGRGTWCSGRGPLGATRGPLRALCPLDVEHLFPGTSPLVLLGDVDQQAVEAQSRNSSTAGVGTWVQTRSGSFAEWSPQEIRQRVEAAGLKGGVILSNPPYGQRLEDDAAASRLHGELRLWLSAFEGFRAGFITSHRGFERELGMRPRVKKPLRNGQLKATFYLYDL